MIQRSTETQKADIDGRVFVFDFDGTLAKNGVITTKNVKGLKSIERKVLNTSRSYESIPEGAKGIFNEIMCLNGSKYYVNGHLEKSFDTMSEQDVNSIVKFAVDNNYNVAFNSTNNYWQNVNNVLSINFMKKNKMQYSEVITIPKKVFLISLSHNRNVSLPLTKLNAHKQTNRLIEISANDKGNINKLFPVYTAIGDGENDKPMFANARKSYLIFDCDIDFKLIKGQR